MTREQPSPDLDLSDGRVAELIVAHAREYAIFTMDLDGRITSWSPGAERITGYGEAEALGMNVAALFTAVDLSAGNDKLEIETAWREGRAEDSRWHVRKDGERFWANGVTMAVPDGDAPRLIKMMRDETPQRLAEEQRILLLNELNHRIKNTLATVQAIADQTLRSNGVERAVREDLTERLIALSEAHNVLVEQSWAGADLRTVVERALAPHEHDGRLQVEGPPLRLSPQQAVAVSMVLHELATNAVKYGGLSSPDGGVGVSWNLALDGQGARHMTLLWAEHGGPPVREPGRRGFGTRLIERSFGQESGGSARLEFAPEGLRCILHLPLSAAEELPMLEVGGLPATPASG